MIVDYIKADQCCNTDAWYTCHKCGECGRVFENGYLVDDGGTTVSDDDDDENLILIENDLI